MDMIISVRMIRLVEGEGGNIAKERRAGIGSIE
jgi:hypothetical protein